MKPRCFLISSFTPLSSLWDMARDIRTALENRDVSVMEYLRSDGGSDDMHRTMLKYIVTFQGPRFLMDFNAAENYFVGETSLYDHYNLPRVSFMTDSPLRHMHRLKEMPRLSAAGLVDRDFHDLVKDFDLPIAHFFDFPHGGPPPRPSPLPQEERQIDALFIGNIGPTPDRATYLSQTVGADPRLQASLSQATDRAFETDDGFYKILKDEFPDYTPDQILPLGNALESYVIATRRKDILSSITRTSVLCHGEIDANTRRSLPDQHKYSDSLSFENGLDLMENTKVLINSSPSFRNGAHERIFYGISRGTKVLIEPTRFFNQAEETSLRLTRMPFKSDEIENALNSALDNDAVSIADAQGQYAKAHTWTQRLDPLMQTVESAFWS